MRLYKFVLVLLIALLAGCASTVKFDPAMKSRLDDGIAISPSVKLAGTPYYHGPEHTWGAVLGGAVGAVVASSMVSEPTKIKNYLETEKIDVGAIVIEEFKRQINEHADFSSKIRDDGKYRLELEIPIYGLVQKHGFSSEYKPMLGLKARMKDTEGKVIWEYYDYVTGGNGDTLGFAYDNYFQNPETFRAAYTSAAKVVVSFVLNDLK